MGSTSLNLFTDFKGLQLLAFDKTCRIKAKSLPQPSSYPFQRQDVTTVSRSLDPFHGLSIALYILSNNLHPLLKRMHGQTAEEAQLKWDEAYEQVSTIITTILRCVPRDRIWTLAQSQLSTTRAAWEALFYGLCSQSMLSFRHPNHKNAFPFLLDFGMQLGWLDFERDGPRSLFYVVLSDYNRIAELLEIHGCRPGVFKFASYGHGMKHFGSAIVAAFFKNRIYDAETLLQAYNPSCNTCELRPTHFQLFIRHITPSHSAFRTGLDYFLRRRADVEQRFCFPDQTMLGPHESRQWNIWPVYNLHGTRNDVYVSDKRPLARETSRCLLFRGLCISPCATVTDVLFYTDREAFDMAASHSKLD